MKQKHHGGQTQCESMSSGMHWRSGACAPNIRAGDDSCGRDYRNFIYTMRSSRSVHVCMCAPNVTKLKYV